MFRGSYTAKGLAGLLKEGGTGRKAAAEKHVEGLGGRLEALYYAFGKDDFYMIVELPGNVNAAGVSLTGNLPGAIEITCTVLMTPEEVDQAAALARENSAAYRPPGK
jgi:uncharacterized protein with GYD domain